MDQHFAISVAVNTLRSGGIIAYPTESVFGLGCDPFNSAALDRLLELKQRPAQAGLILIAGSFDQAMRYIRRSRSLSWKKIQASWPGPTTWVVPAANVHPMVTGGRRTVAMRVPDHPVCQALCNTFGGAIVSTSANITGRKPITTPLQLRKTFGQELDGIVNGALGGQQRPSQIIDAETNNILRAG
ncbi:MAG: threonylcarbamoyl-AMP synthase [Gammaproteobacteria bacterium]|nr:threonylcarbamoyl-AMP synthase [Gammaproteobacteria bacterium]